VIRRPPRYIPPLGPGKKTARQRIVNLWRGYDSDALEKERAPTSKNVAALVPNVLASIRIDKRQSEAEVVKVWNELLNPQVAEHAQPVSLHKGTLFIQVDSSVWLCELNRYHRKEILERLQHSFGSAMIKKLSFRLG
jgi:predicted nucleic acid-binding Zn ribbon protein